MSNKQKILIVVIAVALLVLGFIYLFIPKTQLTLAIAPLKANIQVDNGKKTEMNNGDKLTVSPGTHKITISEDEFSQYQTTVTVKRGETQELLVALTPNTSAAQNLLNNPTAQEIVQRFGGKQLTTQTAKIDNNYPFLKELPIEARLYSIHPCASQKYPDDSTKIAICVDSNIDTPTIKPYIENEFTSRGYKSSDYEVIYTSDVDTGEK
jgi:hypothetical protein